MKEGTNSIEKMERQSRGNEEVIQCRGKVDRT